MISISTMLCKKRAEKKSALVAYITAGDPDLATTKAALHTLEKSGVSAIEIGLPFTDPVADGPVIQRAAERSLEKGFRIEALFEMIREARAEGLSVPLILYTYSNLVFVYGYNSFAKKAAEAGIQGILIVDLPPEEFSSFRGEPAQDPLEHIFLCSPTTNPERLKLIDDTSSAFVYYVAHSGVTGIRDQLPEGLEDKLSFLRANIKKPLAVGFGISCPEHARLLAPHADLIVIGSAYVQIFEDHGHNRESLLQTLEAFTRSLVSAINTP